jgi:hypothetical protein
MRTLLIPQAPKSGKPVKQVKPAVPMDANR